MKSSVLLRCWPDSRAQVIQVWPQLTLVNCLPALVKVSIMAILGCDVNETTFSIIYPRNRKPKSQWQMTGLSHVLTPSSPIPEPIQSQKAAVCNSMTSCRGTDGMTSRRWNMQKYMFLITRLYFSATNWNQMTFPESTSRKTSKFTFSRELEHFIDSKAAALLSLSIRKSQISNS